MASKRGTPHTLEIFILSLLAHLAQGFIQTFVSGEEYKTQGGTIVDAGAVEFRRLTASNFHGFEVVD